MGLKILNATEDDLSGIVEVINSHIKNDFNGILEDQLVTRESKKIWFEQFKSIGPYRLFVAKLNDQIVGYTCSFRYRENKAFDKTIETSIYTHAKNNERGVGSALYTKLSESIKKEKLHTVVVGIALPNEGSVNIHKKFGFEEIGIFKDYIFQNGTYTSSLWMKKLLHKSIS